MTAFFSIAARTLSLPPNQSRDFTANLSDKNHLILLILRLLTCRSRRPHKPELCSPEIYLPGMESICYNVVIAMMFGPVAVICSTSDRETTRSAQR